MYSMCATKCVPDVSARVHVERAARQVEAVRVVEPQCP